jgi:hypothetical protein
LVCRECCMRGICKLWLADSERRRFTLTARQDLLCKVARKSGTFQALHTHVERPDVSEIASSCYPSTSIWQVGPGAAASRSSVVSSTVSTASAKATYIASHPRITVFTQTTPDPSRGREHKPALTALGSTSWVPSTRRYQRRISCRCSSRADSLRARRPRVFCSCSPRSVVSSCSLADHV